MLRRFASGRAPQRTNHTWFLAEAYVMLGEYDAAVDQVRILMASRPPLTASFLRLDPIWDPLRDHPGFQELLEGGN
jgi:hypothetical protein